ncbi:MFS transporter protein [Rutstroemia sp. NJR-2017a BBW]|nr:MFS transporter protein [Rutstroemia sp. NJR-2017a BBW]
MGTITTADPPLVHDGSHRELPTGGASPLNPPVPTVTPLDLIEVTNVRTKLRLYAILSALYLALGVAALDQTIVSIAIPTICSELHSASGFVWIGGAYLLANAATGPIWAKFSDIWGRKVVLLVAVGLFAVSSMIVALSTNMSMLIAGRSLQGAGSGGLIQVVIITISDLFSVRKRSLYLGTRPGGGASGSTSLYVGSHSVYCFCT